MALAAGGELGLLELGEGDDCESVIDGGNVQSMRYDRISIIDRLVQSTL